MKKYTWMFPALALMFTGCKSTPPVNGRVVPEAKLSTGQLLQSGPNRMANLELRDNLDALSLLMDKLYKRNPAEWRKGSAARREDAEANVRTALEQHTPLPGLDARDTAAMHLALDPDFKGDRVATLIYGIGDMLITAHGGKRHQYLIDGLDPKDLQRRSQHRNRHVVARTTQGSRRPAAAPFQRCLRA